MDHYSVLYSHLYQVVTFQQAGPYINLSRVNPLDILSKPLLISVVVGKYQRLSKGTRLGSGMCEVL